LKETVKNFSLSPYRPLKYILLIPSIVAVILGAINTIIDGWNFALFLLLFIHFFLVFSAPAVTAPLMALFAIPEEFVYGFSCVLWHGTRLTTIFIERTLGEGSVKTEVSFIIVALICYIAWINHYKHIQTRPRQPPDYGFPGYPVNGINWPPMSAEDAERKEQEITRYLKEREEYSKAQQISAKETVLKTTGLIAALLLIGAVYIAADLPADHSPTPSSDPTAAQTEPTHTGRLVPIVPNGVETTYIAESSEPQLIHGCPPDTIVYVSDNSEMVHAEEDCSNMKYYTMMTIEEAIECGYDFCSRCW